MIPLIKILSFPYFRKTLEICCMFTLGLCFDLFSPFFSLFLRNSTSSILLTPIPIPHIFPIIFLTSLPSHSLSLSCCSFALRFYLVTMFSSYLLNLTFFSIQLLQDMNGDEVKTPTQFQLKMMHGFQEMSHHHLQPFWDFLAICDSNWPEIFCGDELG